MSKSLGNFFTLRDLVLKGYKPSSIRLLLASIPYRHQLNFTFDGLAQAASNIEKLRNFHLRLSSGNFSAGSSPALAQLARETMERMRSALEDDLNTAQAQAAVFEMVRKANAAFDACEIKQEDVRPLLEALQKFDEIFAVLKDDDGPKMKKILDWAKDSGRGEEISPELLIAVGSGAMSDDEIQTKIDRMQSARKARNFSLADSIRAELTSAGILIEQTKDGVRWRRK